MDDERIFDPQTGKPRLLAQECKTCIFKPDSTFRKGPGKLQPGRFKEMAQADTYVTCHSTLSEDYQAICRGFYDRRSTNILRIYDRIGGFTEVDEPDGP